jgi:ribosomal protein S18 acetylase RimI-like enzyme
MIYRTVRLDEAEEANRIEQLSFPPDEAADVAKIQYRLTHAAELFYGLYKDNNAGPQPHHLIGLCMATRTASTTLSHSSMSQHDINGRTVCLHSICIDPKERRKGNGLNLLKAYLDHLDGLGNVGSVVLITHQPLIVFYKKAGFHVVGPSAVVHGSEPWFEMRIDFTVTNKK